MQVIRTEDVREIDRLGVPACEMGYGATHIGICNLCERGVVTNSPYGVTRYSEWVHTATSRYECAS